MNKKLTILSILLVIVLIFFSYSIFKNDKPIENNPEGQNVASTTDSTASSTPSNPETSSVNTESSIIFFYGDGCPHCALVEKFFKDNNIENKVSFTQKEVYKNKDNANDLVEKAKACGIDTNSIGVPFLWDGSKCLIGDQPIIDFFKQKAGIN